MRDLNMVGSERRAGVLVDLVRRSSVEEGRALLAEWFNLCDAVKPWLPALREQFERCRPVTDDAERMKDELRLPSVVYRAAWSDDYPSEALSWTLDVEVAKRFMGYLTSPRAMFLGMHRTDATPYLWRGLCRDAYGYLVGREESEVIAAHVEEIEAIGALVTPEQAAAYGGS